MALKLPPQHRVDAVPIFVHSSDDAWDFDRINREQEGKSEAEKAKHPVVRYWFRDTRYDLHAKLPLDGQLVSAADYLDLSNAVQFRMRRLDAMEMARVQALVDEADRKGVDPNEAWTLAAKLSVVSVEAPEGQPQDLHELDRMKGAWYVWSVGEAAYWASVPLSDAEKKS